MHDLKISLIILIFVFILRFIVYLISKKKKNDRKKGIMMEMQYLINRFKLDKGKVNTINMALVLSIMDAFIIAASLFLSLRISDNTIIELLIAFVLVFGLIILSNEILGKILKKKGYEKDEL